MRSTDLIAMLQRMVLSKATGIKGFSLAGNILTIAYEDGEKGEVLFDLPADGKTIGGLEVDTGHLVIVLSDGKRVRAEGNLPASVEIGAPTFLAWDPFDDETPTEEQFSGEVTPSIKVLAGMGIVAAHITARLSGPIGPGQVRMIYEIGEAPPTASITVPVGKDLVGEIDTGGIVRIRNIGADKIVLDRTKLSIVASYIYKEVRG